MRTHQTMTVSLPPEMMREVERVRKTERRTRSELVREALRVYFGRMQALPVYTPTRRELRALEKGREALAKGESYTLDEFAHWLLGRPGKKARSKKPAARSTA